MNRSGYSDDCENLELYRATVDRLIKGNRGHAMLRLLARFMDEMEEKVLIADELIDAEGDCCTLGVICKARSVDISDLEMDDIELPQILSHRLGMPWQLVAELMWLNDEAGRCGESPVDRWTRVRGWLWEQIEGKDHADIIHR